MVLTDKIVAYCVCNNVVPESDEAWLRYGIEKRITLLLGLIPQITLAACFSDLPAALGYMVSFSLLRRKTSGYHATDNLQRLFPSALETGAVFRLRFPKP